MDFVAYATDDDGSELPIAARPNDVIKDKKASPEALVVAFGSWATAIALANSDDTSLLKDGPKRQGIPTMAHKMQKRAS